MPHSRMDSISSRYVVHGISFSIAPVNTVDPGSHSCRRRSKMKSQLVDGVPVLAPETREELKEAVESGRPFVAPERLAREFGLPEDEDPDVDVLGDPEDDSDGVADSSE